MANGWNGARVNYLREVGVPSRNILYVRGRGSKFRFRVADVDGGRAHKR